MKILGAYVGDPDKIPAHFEDIMQKVKTLHASIDVVDDPATQFVLKDSCADVSKVMHLLRLSGDILSTGAHADLLNRYTDVLKASVERTLQGPLDHDAWTQATCRSSIGLGIRTADEVALPAFIGSRIAARPAVDRIAQRLESSGFAPLHVIMAAYDQRTSQAIGSFEQVRGADAADIQYVRSLLRDATEAAEQWWTEVENGTAGLTAPRDGDHAPGQSLVEAFEREEVEPNAEGMERRLRRLKNTSAVQCRLSSVVDEIKMDSLCNDLNQQGQEEDLRRIRDLRESAKSGLWWTALNPRTSHVLSAEDWIIAMRLRLGASIFSSPQCCHLCGECVLDTKGYHALCCARGESTVGHNRVRDVFHAGFHLADPTSEIEVPGLVVSAPTLRPADVLTHAAIRGELTAVDVGVSCPNASGAGSDSTETMKQDKLDRYGPYLQELSAQGITYRPAMLSCYGKFHPDASQMMETACQLAAVRQRLKSSGGVSGIRKK